MTSPIGRKKILRGKTEDITSDPERDLMLAALKALEAREGERRGWNRDPQVYMLYRLHPDVDALEVGIVPHLRWMKPRSRRQNFNPADDILWQAAQAAQRIAEAGSPVRPLPRISFSDSPDGLAGVAFMVEAWMVDTSELSPEDRERKQRGERVLYAHKERVECRQVFAADINGNGYSLIRERGHEPIVKAQTVGEGAIVGIPGDGMMSEDGTMSGRLVLAVTALATSARLGFWPSRGPGFSYLR